MTDYQKLANERARQARLSPHYWASHVSDQFTDLVSETMRKEGISQSELAEKSGVTRQYISKMLNGYTNFTIESMQKVAIALGYKVDEINLSPLSKDGYVNSQEIVQWDEPQARKVWKSPVYIQHNSSSYDAASDSDCSNVVVFDQVAA